MQIELPPPRRRALISLTPLIDVVFILLIFFMLASSFLDWSAVPLSTPSAQQTPAVVDEPPLSVRIFVDSGVRIEGEAVERDAIRSVVRQYLDDQPERTVVVQPEGGVPLQQVVDVLDEVRHANPRSMRLARE
ncbi:biopolymer transporter ExbD [Ectothiorhodospira haloalkaliphila]|uniref:Biopolymer transporter ExbD n=1 Tax=Ectothiorhodospira haloalkaliphila TaxID=421628 RepID=W8KP00_9GAMM|nr:MULTISPECIES: biopolymer transporter ExbD [Ectothiorhodospira]AHK78727.1 biopolymer transporter ExbD [Ectothiorhodospira haloalkaliphila]MCG5493862.1 biopolymer transporter ExbD [Ectothiorhodospira variabilis]MCG5497953.1 biopolymer transporter ExbD [Ectothiorhodospira variabilis]MCG5503665.1 biopolymer transporter ExbD [Ectothiorhodospira variabilis]MCG5506821.1 biopolymer transporter ExbD [Ectothiorhodospira variabilis]